MSLICLKFQQYSCTNPQLDSIAVDVFLSKGGAAMLSILSDCYDTLGWAEWTLKMSRIGMEWAPSILFVLKNVQKRVLENIKPMGIIRGVVDCHGYLGEAITSDKKKLNKMKPMHKKFKKPKMSIIRGMVDCFKV